MHNTLKKFFKGFNDGYNLIEPITFWFDKQDNYRDEATGVKGFLVEDHIGIDLVREAAGDDLYVYALRHGDDWCEPSSIEKKEVVVNFYAYFVTDQPLDYLFKDGKDWAECLYDWSCDWGGERYWE